MYAVDLTTCMYAVDLTTCMYAVDLTTCKYAVDIPQLSPIPHFLQHCFENFRDLTLKMWWRKADGGAARTLHSLYTRYSTIIVYRHACQERDSTLVTLHSLLYIHWMRVYGYRHACQERELLALSTLIFYRQFIVYTHSSSPRIL